MPTTEFSVNKRDIQFVLFEQLDIERLCQLPAFSECNRELFSMILDESLKLATEDLAPINAEGDRQGAVFDKGEVKMPAGFHPAYRKFAEGGWIGMAHSPEYGGQGLPNVLKHAVGEIFAGANISFYLGHTLTEGAAHLIERFGNEELRNTYCEKMYSGQWGGTMALTEPSAGSDVGNLKTVAKRNGDNYLISGSKIFITNGEHDLTENIIHAVLARVEGAPAGTKGISLFVVPKFLVKPDGTLGERNDVHCGNIEHKMGMKASPTTTLNFGDEGQCQGWLLGEENGGMAMMFQMMNEERLMVGLQGLALASVAYQSALGYAQERTQGNAVGEKDPGKKTQIINHPDVRRMLMHMKSYTEGLRSMVTAVAQYIDLAEHAQSDSERVRYQHLVELLTPVCKAYGSDMGFRINELAIQVFGGYGYCQEYPVEQYARDQKIASIYEGTNGIQAMDLLGRKIARTGGEYLKEFFGMVLELTRTHENHPALGRHMASLARNVATIEQAATSLATGLAKRPHHSLFNAYPFLEAFGHLVTAYYLLDAAVLAHKKLEELGADAGDVQELLTGNPEAAFYHGRLASASYFVDHVLPLVQALKAGMDSDDLSSLQVVFPQ